ncbi:probable terpene synthase 2 [Abrus precatorius]|uniref:Probable terpene synthase 2 n=1 Tax=Abrus precatorius TaxID=3816 RepID=A0A8B8KI53_ABRPR|nr:probable terpene synthase 2 [Abrus precatorius]
MSLPASTLASTQHAVSDLRRPCVNYAPSMWGDFFLQYASESMEVNDNMKQHVQILRDEVKKMLQSPINQNITHKLNFIDSLQRLGVYYHFQREISQILEQIHNNFTKNNAISEDFDPHSLALLFRLLWQQGYQISSDVFNKFKNDRGNFYETLANDVQGLQCCMDTSTVPVPGWKGFGRWTLLRWTPLSLSLPLLDTTLNAVGHVGVLQMEDAALDAVATATKLKDAALNAAGPVSYAYPYPVRTRYRYVAKIGVPILQRLVEAYLWPLAMSFEPPCSNGRMFGGKLTAVISLVDDTYDAFGTVQELELLTEAIQRWDISPIGSLPQCMKVVFDTIVELCEEMELITAESASFVVPNFKKAFSNLIKGYMVEAKWCHQGYIPTYDEYIVNGVLTSTFPLMITSFIGLGEFATEHVFDWIFSDPKIIKAVSVIGRVLDDMASHKFEQQRVHVASAVECCMKQYGISQEEACNLIHMDVEDCWKDINEEYLKLNDIPKFVLDCVVNLARMSEFTYENHQDKFTNGELLTDCVSSLLVDPICIKQRQ